MRSEKDRDHNRDYQRQKSRQRSRQKRHHRADTYNPNANQQSKHKNFKLRKEHYQKIQSLSNPIDRTLICPFLVRIYYFINGVNHYSKQSQLPKERELILYLWMDSTLRQITQLVRAHLPAVRTKQRFVYSRVFEEAGKWVQKDMGTVMVHKKDKNYHEHETTTLERSSFSIGDYIDVSINYQ